MTYDVQTSEIYTAGDRAGETATIALLARTKLASDIDIGAAFGRHRNTSTSRMTSIADHHIAALCRRGHVISADALPGADEKRRCGTCGAQVFIACPLCEAPVLGPLRHAVRVVAWKPDEFCWACGRPYPWASRESIALHIENLLEEQQDLSDGDRRVLLEQLATLREPPVNPDIERQQIGTLDSLKRLAPKAWKLAEPLAWILQ